MTKEILNGDAVPEEDLLDLVDSKDLKKAKLSANKSSGPSFFNKKFLLINSSHTDLTWSESYFEKIFQTLHTTQSYETKIFFSTQMYRVSETFLNFLKKEEFLIYDIPREETIPDSQENLISLLSQYRSKKVFILIDNLSDFYEKMNLEINKQIVEATQKFSGGQLSPFFGYPFRQVESKKNLDFLHVLRLAEATILANVNSEKDTTKTILDSVKQSSEIESYFDVILNLKESGLFVVKDNEKLLKIKNKVVTHLKLAL